MSAPAISILMPMRNAERFVGEALRSLLCERELAIEVIVVDDGSSDRSAEVVRRVGDSRIRMIPGPQRGISAAMNAAVAQARGPILMRCDADDLYPPDRLGWQARWLREHPEFTAVCGRYGTIDDDGRPVAVFRSGEQAGEITAELRAGVTRTHLCSFAIRAEALREMGGFREYFQTAEDIDMQLRLGHHGRVWYDPRICYHYRLHDASITHTQGNTHREFFHQVATDCQAQRLATGMDDLQRGCPPPLPAEAGCAHGSRGQIQGILLGAAWDHHRRGRRLMAFRTALRACLAQPSSLPTWKSLAAIIIKRPA